ncbi:hypothetical protein BDN72DRAFT_850130 [Pluteus cervinus]|uniref:Uncharacterized protein n=1 Tax=Pluteus cervinus TaxID=181527 RepID=A0ACD3A608_9AGAR|nr:hypothetical protein BDN72DRAFT_850130 [Pluteus cervinus]
MPSKACDILAKLVVVFTFVNILTTLATAVIFAENSNPFYIVVAWLIVAVSALTLVWLIIILLFKRKSQADHRLNDPKAHLWTLYVLVPLWLALALIITVQTPPWCTSGHKVYKCLAPIGSTTWSWLITVLLTGSILCLGREPNVGFGLRRTKTTNSDFDNRLVKA